MGILNRIFGSGEAKSQPAPSGAEDRALERYRYLLRTAPPDAIEAAHAEAFAQLTGEQRAQVLRELSAELPPGERDVGADRDDPKSLARLATRAELRQPGTMERALDRGAGGMLGGGLLTSVAGAFIGSAIARQMFGDASAAGEPVEDSSDQAGPSGFDDDASDVDVGDF